MEVLILSGSVACCCILSTSRLQKSMLICGQAVDMNGVYVMETVLGCKRAVCSTVIQREDLEEHCWSMFVWANHVESRVHSSRLFACDALVVGRFTHPAGARRLLHRKSFGKFVG